LRQRKDGRASSTCKGDERRGEDEMRASLLITEDMVREALREVIDPELGENLVDLGLVYGVTVEANQVAVDLTLTTPGCPLHASLHAAAERAIRLMVPGVDSVHIQLVCAWGADRLGQIGAPIVVAVPSRVAAVLAGPLPNVAAPLALGGSLLFCAISLYVGIVLVTLRRAKQRDVVFWHLAVAVIGLATAASLGLMLAFSKSGGLLGRLTLPILAAHATLMLGCWVAGSRTC
jgi:metal-sulfur cluster biosynthetic enzyme